MITNTRKIQIVSLPRSGSSHLYKILLEGTRIGRIPPFDNLPTEIFNFMNKTIFEDEYRNRLSHIAEADECIIKLQITNLYDLELKNHRLIYEYIKKTSDMYNIFLIRKTIVENILSHCIAHHTRIWDTHHDSTITPFFLGQEQVVNTSKYVLQDYLHLLNNTFQIDCHEVVYYEDIINKDKKHVFELLKIFNFYKEHNYYCTSSTVANPEKSTIIKNIDQAKEWVREFLNNEIQLKKLPITIKNDELELS